MIFVDSNVPMYLVGAPHPYKLDSQRLVESALTAGERLVTDAEVLLLSGRRACGVRTSRLH